MAVSRRFRRLAVMLAAACLMGCWGGAKDAKDKVETKIDTIDKSDSTPAVSQDSRLVNKEGEAWTCYTGGNRAGSYDGITFQANGNFAFIIASGLLPDDEPIDYDVWNIETTGTWYTEGNKTITVSNNGRTYTMPYTIETTARSNERLFLNADDIYESIGDDCEIWCSNAGFYYRNEIKVMK